MVYESVQTNSANRKWVYSMPKKQTEWTRSFNERAYDRLAITIPKGMKITVDQYAKSRGDTINGLVNTLLRERIGLTPAEWKKGRKIPGD